MLLTTMPLWLTVICFVICFAVKHCASERVERLEVYRMSLQRHTWINSVVYLSTFNGLMTFGILYPFIGWWALFSTAADALYHAATGVYKVKRQVSCCWRKPPLFSEINALRAVHVGSYISFTAIAVGLLQHKAA